MSFFKSGSTLQNDFDLIRGKINIAVLLERTDKNSSYENIIYDMISVFRTHSIFNYMTKKYE